MRIAAAAFALSSLMVLAPAQADDVSYNFLDVGYARVDIDDFNEDADGLLLRASFELTRSFFLFGGYNDLSVDVLGVDVDLTEYDIGLGYAWPVGINSSFYGKVSYVSAEAEVFSQSVDDDGYGAALGLRSRVADNFELEGYVDYVDLNDSGDETSFGLGARWFISNQFALGAEAVFGEDATTYGAGFRWHWGR